jgi:membrane protease YdiL (CAAX protease family)
LAKDDSLALQPLASHWLGSLLFCFAIVSVYAVFVRIFEKRWPREVSVTGIWSWLPVGFVIGTALITASALLIRFGGWSIVEQTRPSSEWAQLIALAVGSQLAVACIEEVLIRGLLFRLVEECLGSWWALAISAVLFGLAHLSNDNATWVAALGLSLQAGVLLGAAFMFSRSLWLPIGIHWAWNGIQAGVFGGALSGTTVRAIYSISPAGPAYLSGGTFGIEGSLISTVLCAITGCGFCVAAFQFQSVYRGFWARQPKNGQWTEPGDAPKPPVSRDSES